MNAVSLVHPMPRALSAIPTRDSTPTLGARDYARIDAALDVGLSGPSRLHDLFVAVEAMTPGEYKAQGRDLEIRYGFHETPFGPALLLATDRGVCGFDFIAGSERAALGEAKARWPL